MATFKAQIEDLVGAVGDDTALTDWLQAGTREIINILPPDLKQYCFSKQTFTSNAANSEAETMITGQLGSVYAGSVECRQIRPMDKHKASDSASIQYASATDPVYYIEGNKINILPASSSGVYYVVANPTVAHGSTSIDNFPNEAEYLVVLYASVKGLQRLMNEMNSNTDVTTAFTASNTELDETQALADSVNAEIVLANAEVDKAFAEVALAKTEAAELATQTDNSGDISTALTAINTAADRIATYNWTNGATFDTTNKQLTRVKDALDNAQKIIDDGANSPTGNAAGDAASYLYDEEDTELVESAIKIADSEIKRAQAHIAEWMSIAEAALTEVNSFSREVESRTGFSGAKSLAIKGYIDTANAYAKTAEGYIKTASAYGQEIQLKIGIAAGYIQEAAARMQENQQQYQWYQSQQLKLQQDYDKGIKMLVSGSIPYEEEQQSKRR